MHGVTPMSESKDKSAMADVVATLRARVSQLERETTACDEDKETLRKTEEHFRKIFEYSNDMIFIIDPSQDRIVDGNPKACKLLGYCREELLAMPMSAIHPAEMPQLLAFAHLVFEKGYGWTNELTCLTKSGSTLPSEISASSIDIEGRPCIIALVRDITDRKKAEQALKESEERLSRILESAMDAIVMIDEDKQIRLFNLAAESVFLCSSTDVVGKSFDGYLSDSFRKLLEGYIDSSKEESVRKPSLWVSDWLTAFRANGEEFTIEATCSHFETGGRKYFTLILRDTNERKRAQEELRKLQMVNLYLQEEIKLTHDFEQIIGRSEPLKKALQKVEQVASTDATVLILGETGTGKELFARAIHSISRRKDRPLVKVNCAALPPTLIESDLFGHEKGAFTGAFSQRIGRFELANGGTIFLDEIGDLSPELQVKLLRILQDGEFERVGGSRTIKVDVRVIAATNRNLEKAIRAGNFREDLYYRLNVFPISLPPLRERKEDIPLLVKQFAAKSSTKLGKKIDQIPEECMTLLMEYVWPGNIRELENIIERAMIITKDSKLRIDESLVAKERLPGNTLDEVQREHIQNALEKCNWIIEGKGGAAASLGIPSSTLRDRIQKLGLKRPNRT